MGPIQAIRLFRLYLKVKPLLSVLEGEIKMKFSFNSVLQIIGTIGQIFNVVGGFVPAKYQGLVAGILGGVQGVVATIAHFTNPDGTPASTPYNPPSSLK